MNPSLPHLLCRNRSVELSTKNLNIADFKKMLRFWLGTQANRLRADELQKEFDRLFASPDRLRAGLNELTPLEKTVLGVYKRYGGTMSSALALAEMRARDLMPVEKRGTIFSGSGREKDVTQSLRSRGILLSAHGPRHYDSWGAAVIPEQTINPKLLPWVKETAPLPWPTKKPPSGVSRTRMRSAVGVVLDLSAIGQTLIEVSPWKTNRGGSMPKNLSTRLKKSIPDHSEDAMIPPRVEGLYYELLRGLGVVTVSEDFGSIDSAALMRSFQSGVVEQAWNWVKSWLQIDFWHDGYGQIVGMRSERLESTKLYACKEQLVWALGRIAFGKNDWLDLETFLWDLHSSSDGQEHYDYGTEYHWTAPFINAQTARKADDFHQRLRFLWMMYRGNLFANMLMVTLPHLGLIETGTHEPKPATSLCFRLTPLGKAVFAIPDPIVAMPVVGAKCLTIQPNYDVLLFVDEATVESAWLLPRIAKRTSAPDNRVQTFAMSRDSVYQALEAGLTLEQIRNFLQQQSKNGIPDNVARTMLEWSSRREAMVIHSDMALEIQPLEPDLVVAQGRKIGEVFRVGSAHSHRNKVPDTSIFYPAERRAYWNVDEKGEVRFQQPGDSIALARLMQFAERKHDRWHITEASIHWARDRGYTQEQILDWLKHYGSAVPPIVETMIRNWLKPVAVFLDKAILLQVQQVQAAQMLQTSSRFKPFLLGHIPPNWFLVDPEKKKELEKELKQIGFKLDGDYKLSASTTSETSSSE